METLRRTSRTTILVTAAAVLWVSMAFGYWLNVGDDDKKVVAWIVACAIGTLILAGLLLRLVPASESEADGNAPARRALVFGAVALLTCAAFWTGLPIILGVTALVLAAEGRARAGTYARGGEATAGGLLGGFAALATVVLLISGA